MGRVVLYPGNGGVMVKLYSRPSVPEDAEKLALTLRPADLREIQAQSSIPPQEALLTGIRFSDLPLTIVAGDDLATPLALYGVVSLPNPDLREGAVWLLASTALEAHKRAFIRQCRPWLDTLLQQYDLLHNRVDSRNTLHLRWLRWCGFTFLREVRVGAEEVLFYEFVRINHV